MARQGAPAARNGQARSSQAYDLRRFKPPPIRFVLDDPDRPDNPDGREYAITGDPDIDLMAEILHLDNLLRGQTQDLDDLSDEDENREIATAIVRAKEIVLGLIQQQDPTVTSIRIGVGQILSLFALLHGGETAAEGLARTLTEGMAQLSEQEQAELAQRYRELEAEGDEGAADAPLGSRLRSSGRSRSSTGPRTAATAGPRAGG